MSFHPVQDGQAWVEGCVSHLCCRGMPANTFRLKCEIESLTYLQHCDRHTGRFDFLVVGFIPEDGLGE